MKAYDLSSELNADFLESAPESARRSISVDGGPPPVPKNWQQCSVIDFYTEVF